MFQSMNPNQNLNSNFDDKNEMLLGTLQNPASNWKPSGLPLSSCKTPAGLKLFSLCTQSRSCSAILTLSIKSLYIILCEENRLQWITENQRIFSSKIAPTRCHLLVVKRTILAIWLGSYFIWNKKNWFVKILFDLDIQLISIFSTWQTKKFCSKFFFELSCMARIVLFSTNRWHNFGVKILLSSCYKMQMVQR